MDRIEYMKTKIVKKTRKNNYFKGHEKQLNNLKLDWLIWIIHTGIRKF